MKDILDQEKKSIEANKSKHPIVTFAVTFHKPAGEANPYFWFGYGPQKIFNHDLGKISGSMNADLVYLNSKVGNKQRKYDN